MGTFVAATALLLYGAGEVLQLVGALFRPGSSHGVERVTSPPLLLGISASAARSRAWTRSSGERQRVQARWAVP